MIWGIRWVLAAVLFAWSLLVMVPATSLLLWIFSVGAKEYGHWIALAALLPLLGISLRSRAGVLVTILSVLTIGLFLSTSVRAWFFARDLTQQLQSAFGPVDQSRLLSTDPFSFSRLWLGGKAQPVQVENYEFAQPEGKPLSLRFFPQRERGECALHRDAAHRRLEPGESR
ncbi:MAG: hypothetical protein QM796_15260 [Chthoniobacteraceae bacterium]